MKKMLSLMLILAVLLCGCQTPPVETTQETRVDGDGQNEDWKNVTQISLDGSDVYVEEGMGVYADHDIVYYEAGHDFTYGEGETGDAHEASEAEAHTVVHITRPGTYRIYGTLSAGQIAVDLGEDAESDPGAVVTLILDGLDITCTVAPAIIFYNVYECGAADTETAGPVVDTSAAGANVVIADGSVNTVNGSYVAKIYRPDSVVLSEDGTEVADAKKLHKYDAALYSRMSMNVSGGELGDGVLTINAENEGLDSELHLTVNGGNIAINSGNDGINTNADGVSVTTVNGGSLTIKVLGTTGEGDGIDSNGWLVINGGTVVSAACGFSGDAGIDSDMGIYINGGTVMASGNMLDRIAGGEATWAVFQFASSQKGGNTYTLRDETGNAVMECAPVNDFTCLILSGNLTPGTYSFWMGDAQLAGVSGEGMGGSGFFGGMEGNVGTPGDVPGRFEGEPPEGDYQLPPQPGGQMMPQGGQPGTTPPQTGSSDDSAGAQGETGTGGITKDNPLEGMPGAIGGQPPEGDYQLPPQPGGDAQPQGGDMPTMPEGQLPPEGMGHRPQGGVTGEASTDFTIVQGGNYFVNVGSPENGAMPIQ